MAVSLFSISKSFLNNSLISKASNFLDEDTGEIKHSINAILTALYAKIIDISQSKKKLNEIYELIITSHFNNLQYINLNDLFSGENSLLIDESTVFLNLLYKEQVEPLYYLVSENHRIHKESSTALVKMVLPIIVGSINKVLYTEKLNANGFYQLLNDQKKYFNHVDAPDAFIDGLIEKFNFDFLAKKRKPVLQITQEETTSGSKFNFKLVAASVVGFLILGSAYYTSIRAFDNPKKEKIKNIEKNKELKQIKANTVDNTYYLFAPTDRVLGKYVKNYEFLGRFIEKILPNSVKIIIPANGGEAKLINFIENTDASIQDAQWYPLRRIVSSKGTNSVHEKSTNQISNLVSILEAYPNVHLTIGGYSYNQNDPIKNFEASYKFVEEVTKEVLKSNINESRIRFEGYGNNYQLEKGPLEPKRIGIRVTRK